MEAASARPPVSPQGAHQGGHSVDALNEFLAASCAAYEPRDAFIGPAIQLDVAPPSYHEEISHEQAFGFAFADEMKVVRQLQAKYDQGRNLFLRVYFARGLAAAIPPAPPSTTEASEVAKLLRYYGGVYEMLKPQIAKLRMLCEYCTVTVGVLSDTIQRIAAQENTHRVIPDVLLDSIIEVMDIMLQMNQLHDRKSSLRNDFSLFKRAFKHVQGDVSDSESVQKEIHRLQEFVGSTTQSKNAIWESLRHNLTSVKRYSQVIFLLVRQCLNHLESSWCLLPQERFKFIRVLPCLMAVLNADPLRASLNGFHSAERKLIEATGKIVSRYPVVPIFADLYVKPLGLAHEMNLSMKLDYGSTSERSWDAAYDLGSTLSRARQECADFLPRLMFTFNKIRRPSALRVDDDLAATVTALTIEGLRLLSDWRTSLLLFLSSKYQKPKSDDELEHMGVSLNSLHLEYQRIVTYNFEPEELKAITAVVDLIKSVARVFEHHSARIATCVRSNLYRCVQEFVQLVLMTILHRADKKKHPSTKLLQDLRLMCGDWTRDDTPTDDFKKRRRERRFPSLSSRIVPPTRSQLQMLRTVVNATYAKKTSSEWEPKANIFAFHRELKSSDNDKLQSFYDQTASFSMLLDLDKTIAQLSSFPELMYRELFLEIAKSPQLPVGDSFPWLILAHGGVHGPASLDILLAFSLLEIYNDAGTHLLEICEQVSVCDEIVAEAKLFFDNLTYIVAESLFTAAKSEVARTLIGTEWLMKIHGSHGQHHSCSTAVSSASFFRNLRAVTSARHIDVIDERCNVAALVSIHLNARFVRDLRLTFARVARTDMTIFVATVDLLELLRRTHSLLSDEILLDSFDSMWLEVSKSPNSGPGRTMKPSHQCIGGLRRISSAALTQDLAAMYGFNCCTQRFFRTPLPVELRSHSTKARVVDVSPLESTRDVALVTSKSLLNGVGLDRDGRVGFDLIHQPFRSFVGLPHFEALYSFLSESDVVGTVLDCEDLIMSQIEDVVHLFVPVLGSAIPPYRHPRVLYRTEGCYGYFEGKFRHMMDSKELESHVFHSLRMFGNTLLAVYFMGQVKRARERESSADEASSDLFVHTLQRLHDYLVETDLTTKWRADLNTNPELVGNLPSAFFLVWNALEFLSCCSQRHGSSICYRETYGEGVYFAGCTLVHLLGQRTQYECWNPSQQVLDTHAYDDTKESAQSAIKHNSRGRKVSSANALPGTVHAVGTLDSDMVTSAKMFVKQATQMRQTCKHFFSLLESAWPVPVVSAVEPRAEFAPPS